MTCRACGHKPSVNDPATPGDLPVNLDERDVGASWTVRSTHRQYTWVGEYYVIGHRCPV